MTKPAHAHRLISLAEATALVRPGDTLALGGNMLYRRPVAFVRALLRRSDLPRELTLLAITAGYESDLLVGAGLVRQTRTCYFGLEAFGFAPMFTEAVHAGRCTVIEETEASLAFGIRATMAGVDFMPSRAWLGTDLLALRPDVQTLASPYSGEEVVAFPAIDCDVAVIHALAADPQGNVRLNKNLGIDLELAVIARTVIVTTEAVVDRLDEADLPGALVDHVVEAPRGAWPTSCYPHYSINGDELLRYLDACGAGAFDAYCATLTQEN